MSDGCDGVTIERSSRDGKNPYRHIVTTDTDRHTVSEGHGNHYKRVPGRGVVRRQRGSSPSPEGQIPPIAGEMSLSDKGGAGPAGPHGTLQPPWMKVP